MSFIPSKLGLRTHLLTQINLAQRRVARGKIHAVCCSHLWHKLWSLFFMPDNCITIEALSSSLWIFCLTILRWLHVHCREYETHFEACINSQRRNSSVANKKQEQKTVSIVNFLRPDLFQCQSCRKKIQYLNFSQIYQSDAEFLQNLTN